MKKQVFLYIVLPVATRVRGAAFKSIVFNSSVKIGIQYQSRHGKRMPQQRHPFQSVEEVNVVSSCALCG